MPTLKNITKWECSNCHAIYDDEVSAISCEDDHRKSENEKIFRTFFPAHHKKDDNYTTHCVDCGVLLKKYEREWNGYDHPTCGKLSFEIKEKTYKELGGWRCSKCYETLISNIVKYYTAFESVK
jgi:hypothetical protein